MLTYSHTKLGLFTIFTFLITGSLFMALTLFPVPVAHAQSGTFASWPGSATPITTQATEIAETSAVLNGSASGGSVLYYRFEYGTTNMLGRTTLFRPALSGAMSALVLDLSPSQIYYYRLVVQDEYAFMTNGKVMSFMTGYTVPAGGAGATLSSQAGQASSANFSSSAGGAKNSSVTGDGTLSDSYMPETSPLGSGLLRSFGMKGSPCFKIVSAIDKRDLATDQKFAYTVSVKNTCTVGFSNLALAIQIPKEFSFISSSVPLEKSAENIFTVYIGSIYPSTQIIVPLDLQVKSSDAIQPGSVNTYARLNFIDAGKKHAIATTKTISVEYGIFTSLANLFRSENSQTAQISRSVPGSAVLNFILVVLLLLVVGWIVWKSDSTPLFKNSIFKSFKSNSHGKAPIIAFAPEKSH